MKGDFFVDINKLKNQLKNKNSNGNMTRFDKIFVIYLGNEPKEYYKKMKDQNGNLLKDSNGEALRSPTPTGITYTFSELGTNRIVKAVFNQKINVELLDLMYISGLGYDIKQSSMLFIQEIIEATRYEQK